MGRCHICTCMHTAQHFSSRRASFRRGRRVWGSSHRSQIKCAISDSSSKSPTQLRQDTHSCVSSSETDIFSSLNPKSSWAKYLAFMGQKKKKKERPYASQALLKLLWNNLSTVSDHYVKAFDVSFTKWSLCPTILLSYGAETQEQWHTLKWGVTCYSIRIGSIAKLSLNILWRTYYLCTVKGKRILSLSQLCLLLTLIFPWTKLVMSSFESNTDKVFITLCSSHSQCSVISSLLDPIEKESIILN